MSEFEELVKLLDGFSYDIKNYVGNNTFFIVDNHVELAKYLIENAVTILPYRVGDKIYYIDRHTNKVEEDIIKFITITKSGPKPILTWHNKHFWKYYVFGVNVFLNRESAEAAIKNNICT